MYICNDNNIHIKYTCNVFYICVCVCVSVYVCYYSVVCLLAAGLRFNLYFSPLIIFTVICHPFN